MTSTESTALATITARAEIHDALLRYCRGIDRCDVELVRSAYHNDSVDVRGDYRANGWDLAENVVKDTKRDFVRTTHVMTNILIEVDDDRHARAESLLFSYIWAESRGAESLSVFVGRYFDRFERRDGRWAIAHRVFVQDWSVGQLKPEPWANPFVAVLPRGTRDETDLSYELFKA